MQNGDGIHLYDGKEFTAITNRNYEAKHEWAKSKGDVWFGLDAGLSFSEAEGQWGRPIATTMANALFSPFPSRRPANEHVSIP